VVDEDYPCQCGHGRFIHNFFIQWCFSSSCSCPEFREDNLRYLEWESKRRDA